MAEITTVTITQGEKNAPVRSLAVTAEVIAPGLAITPALDKNNALIGAWTITHLPSGFAIYELSACIGCLRYAARKLTEAGIDWTRDHDSLIADETVRQAASNFARYAYGCDGSDCGIADAIPETVAS